MSVPIYQTATFASDELAAAGIGSGLRCSIGLEDVDDLLADTTGLEAARGATPAPATA